MKNKVKFILIFLLLFILLGYFFVYRPAKKIQAKATNLLPKVADLKKSFSENDIDLVNKKLTELLNQYEDFKNEAKKIYWLSFIPYVADFRYGVEAGDYLLLAAKQAVETISPYADLIGFKKGSSSFVEQSAEERLHTAVLTLDKILTKVDPISDNLAQAEKRIHLIKPERYPEKIGQLIIRQRIENMKEQILGFSSLFVEAKPLIKNLPKILGKDSEKKYLVLFQNDKELRATGGFLTAYAIFRIKDGKMRIEKSDDIYSLDQSISSHPQAPKEILTYHKDVYRFYIRDSNLSPDFPTSIKYFQSLYEKSPLKVSYDGIIAIDTKVLVDMLTIFGDTEVNGIVFSAKIDDRCNCPQVIYRLFDIIDRPTPYLRENRKGILGDLMYTLFYKALGFSPSKYWGTLAQQMFQNLKEKHILLYFIDENLQQAAEKVNFAGRIRDYDGDYLHINNVNFAGAKSNMFVNESITSKIESKGEKIVREVVVDYRNPYPHSDCNLERGGLCLNATLRNWVRVYVPRGSKLISFQGSLKKVNVYEDLGKTVFEGYLEVPTQGKAQIRVIYELPFSKKSPYSLLIQKQPGVGSQKLKIQAFDKIYFNQWLKEDYELKIK
jgi:cbb3-type cytochrome oxidase subunit 3